MIQRVKNLLLTNTTARQTVVKNTFWLFAGEFMSRLLRGAIVIYAARVLGAEQYGAFAYVLAISGFIAIFSDFGISAILTRESVKDPAVQKEYFSTALAIKSVFLLINTAVILLLIPHITTLAGAFPLLPLAALMLIFDAVREFSYSIFRAHERMEREALLDVSTNAAVSLLGFAALYTSATAHSLMFGYVSGSALGFIGAVFLLLPYFRDFTSHVRPALIKRILLLSWPMGLLSVLGSLMINTDMIMISWWKSAAQVGYYAAAQKPILLLYVVPALLASATFPVFARLARVNNDRFREVFEKTIAVVAALAFPMVAAGSVLAPEIIRILYGGGYEPAVSTFNLLLTTLILVFPSALLSNALFAYNEQRQFLLFTLFGALSNALLDYLLIPWYGIEGAALATVICQLLTNFLIWRKMKSINHFRILFRLPRILIGSLLCAAIAFLLNSYNVPILATIIIAGVAYVLFLWVIKEPLIHEVQGVFKAEA